VIFRVNFFLLRMLLSLAPRVSVEKAIIRAEEKAIARNGGFLRPDQKRKLDLLTRWNDERS